MSFTSKPTLTLSSLFWLAVTIYGGYIIYNIQKEVKFGIDLVGGTYLTLEVKVEEAIKNELMGPIHNFIDKLKKTDMEQEISGVPNVNGAIGTGTLNFNSDLAATKALTLWNDQNISNLITVSQSGKELIFNIPASEIANLNQEAIQADISILRSRLDPYGAGEIPIFPQGLKNIAIELPNVSDPEQAKARIGKAAMLEMKPVLDFDQTKDKLLEKYDGLLPEGTEIVPSKEDKAVYLVPTYAKFTGKLLKSADYAFHGNQDIFSKNGRKSPHQVEFQLKPAGSEIFYNLTKEAIDDNKEISHPARIAIILDNVIISAPSVEEPLDSDRIIISGNFTEESARELVALIKSGAFAAPVEVIEERHIGPSLGQESIYKGLLSCGIGLILLFLFSIVFYKTAGIFAFIVLLYNLLFILFGLIWLNGTLTLPGIAGMVLTIGMAIDSSILIYERIKEELLSGSSLRTSINEGFSGATSVILDANITTFIVGLVLYYLGSPAIQGFALTMMIGIIATLVTGLLMLRWIFNFVLEGLHVQKIKF